MQNTGHSAHLPAIAELASRPEQSIPEGSLAGQMIIRTVEKFDVVNLAQLMT